MRLCLIGNPNIAHIQRWTRDFLNLGWEVHLIGEHSTSKPLPKGCIFYDLTKQTNIRKFRYLAWAVAIRRLVKQIQPHIVHSLGITSAGWLGAAGGRKPFIVSALGSDLMLLHERSYFHRLLSRWTMQQADYVICVSQPLFIKAGEYGVDVSKREVVYMGVDTKIFAPVENREKLRRQLHLPDGPMVLSIRALNPVYHPLDLARAIPGVLQQAPGAKFAIFTYNAQAGLVEQFKQIVAQSGADDSVTFIPPLDDDRIIASYFQAADVAVSIPASDGMPVSVLEAMGCKCALVTTDLPNLKEWITHEKEGLLIPVGDSRALEDALVRLLSDADLRSKLQANAARRIQEQGSRQASIQRCIEIYTQSGHW